MKDYSQKANKEVLEMVVSHIKKNNMGATLVSDSKTAKELVLSMIDKSAEVFTSTSATLESIEIDSAINESGNYKSVRNKLNKLDREKDSKTMNQLGATPDIVIGSVHSITEDGRLVVVSNTGSQLPAYSYGANKVIFVVGAQKIVKDLPEAIERITNYTLPLESKRVQKAYGMPKSEIRKWLIIDSELIPDRIHVVIVNENLGY